MELARAMTWSAGRGARALLARAVAAPLTRLPLGARRAHDLVLAPQDLRTADPTVGADILAGRFAFAGCAVAGAPADIFAAAAPSADWAEALHGFGWLRDLEACRSADARAVARALIEAWLGTHAGMRGEAWRPSIAAARLLAWLSHSPFLLEDADLAFYRRLVRALGRHARRLACAAPFLEPGRERLAATIALAAAALALAAPRRALERASARLDRELRRQILPDGGHVSRHPGAVVDLLADLLPLRQAYVAASEAPPAGLLEAVDRLMPMLRFYRHGDGAFALFNGMGPTPHDLVASLLAYDDSRALPVRNAPYAGYQRLEGDGLVVLADTGPPPPAPHAADAHAGALAFEFSAGTQRIVVGCGLPAVGRAPWRRVARATAAHSTLAVGDVSSCRFSTDGEGPLRLISGPRDVVVERSGSEAGEGFSATHDGYAASFGLLHRRTLVVAADGTRLVGEDRIVPARAGAQPADAPLAVRFHLHPSLRSSVTKAGRGALIATPDGAAWEFTSDDAEATLEESVFLAAPEGPRRAEQIVIHGRTRATPTLRWRFERVGGTSGHVRAKPRPAPLLAL
jgi:uncharacterized heparinase superfamily protein